MTHLRQQMIDAMHQRGFSVRTHQSYLAAVRDLARYFHQPPDQIVPAQIQQYFDYLVKERHLSGASCRLYLNGLRFLYCQVLSWEEFDVPIHYPKKVLKIPELLTRDEVKRIIDACFNRKHRMMLMVCYGCGLRVSELVTIKVHHIDGERHLLRVEQGKGAKDRMVVISPALLNYLREYWCLYRPNEWFFPNNRNSKQHLCQTTIQKVFKLTKNKVSIEKIGGIHSLRHAYATHQLENGLPVNELQRQLGHKDLHSTLHYVHWVPNYQQGKVAYSDLVGQLEVGYE
ncbi:MAG: tyrosine-type recombinase/integrase [Planctomycetia bacterium]|nr:tyrosine-type recombinase/integrase [Planctomycetia bacterium]